MNDQSLIHHIRTIAANVRRCGTQSIEGFQRLERLVGEIIALREPACEVSIPPYAREVLRE